jgi:hypothetical protein
VHGLLQNAVGQQFAEACLDYGVRQIQGVAVLSRFQLLRVDLDVLTDAGGIRLPQQQDSSSPAPRGKREALNQLFIGLYRIGPRRLHLVDPAQ